MVRLSSDPLLWSRRLSEASDLLFLVLLRIWFWCCLASKRTALKWGFCHPVGPVTATGGAWFESHLYSMMSRFARDKNLLSFTANNWGIRPDTWLLSTLNRSLFVAICPTEIQTSYWNQANQPTTIQLKSNIKSVPQNIETVASALFGTERLHSGRPMRVFPPN